MKPLNEMPGEMLLPKDKCDVQAVEALKELTDEAITPLIPSLLTWLQDWNWPVAAPVAEVLDVHRKIAEPCIVQVLQASNDDDVWKYFIIAELLPRMQGVPSKQMFDAVMRIAGNPTVGEKEEMVHEAAQTCIDRWNKLCEKEVHT